MSTINDTDLLLVNRGGDDFKFTAKDLQDAKITNTDLLLVNRDNKDYSISATELENSIADDDWLLINRGATNYKVSGKDVLEYLGPSEPKMPWYDEPGSIWHIKNVTGYDLSLNAGRNAKFPAWDIDGTNRRDIDVCRIGEELVFRANLSITAVFLGNKRKQRWEFGELTDTSQMTNMYHLFYECNGGPAFNKGETIDTSNVTNMAGLLYNCQEFTGDLNSWDVSKVTNMSSMFNSASNAVFDVSSWDVSNVEDMSSMFRSAMQFNSDLSGWDTSKVKDMSWMFDGARKFNSDISGWDISTVDAGDMDYMFRQATEFNQDLRGWCVTKIQKEPINFGTFADKFDKAMYPVWGTCP